MRNQIEKKKIQESFEKVKKDIDDLKEKIDMLEKSQPVSASLSQSQNKIETKIIDRIKRNKKSLVMIEINKLIPLHSTIEIFEIIVKEKGLCSKASFYRYISSLKSQSQSQTTARTTACSTAYNNQKWTSNKNPETGQELF